MNEVEISAFEEKWSRWKRPIQYVTGAAFILILYVFIYPAILLYFDNNETIVDEAPEVIFGHYLFSGHSNRISL